MKNIYVMEKKRPENFSVNQVKMALDLVGDEDVIPFYREDDSHRYLAYIPASMMDCKKTVEEMIQSATNRRDAACRTNLSEGNSIFLIPQTGEDGIVSTKDMVGVQTPYGFLKATLSPDYDPATGIYPGIAIYLCSGGQETMLSRVEYVSGLDFFNEGKPTHMHDKDGQRMEVHPARMDDDHKLIPGLSIHVYESLTGSDPAMTHVYPYCAMEVHPEYNEDLLRLMENENKNGRGLLKVETPVGTLAVVHGIDVFGCHGLDVKLIADGVGCSILWAEYVEEEPLEGDNGAWTASEVPVQRIDSAKNVMPGLVTRFWMEAEDYEAPAYRVFHY